MSELSLDSLDAAGKARLPIGYRRLTPEQCRTTMVRFSPDCAIERLRACLAAAGYVVAQPDANGVCWVREAT